MGLGEMAEQPFLAIYLRDHFAGATAGLELARRVSRSATGTGQAPFYADLAHRIAADREALRDVMATLGVAPSSVKNALAWTLEKAGRLKLNGRVLRPSPLSRLVELETLALGVTGKKTLWRSLATIKAFDSRLASVDFDALLAGAEEQAREVERHRLQAAETAFSQRSSTRESGR
jgi:hypothetical protein